MINRNNYEEYLLFYLDGELSQDERLQVEAFLRDNPDLDEELRVLEQTILQPESLEFEDKQRLYRKETGINAGNYQEYFLLYVDEELNTLEKTAVETFVLQNPAVQDEFTLLKQAVLPRETMVFENKELLYRKEENRKPVVISLFRIAVAAAVLLGIVSLLWVFDNNSGTDPISGVQPGIQNPVTIPGKTTRPLATDDKATIAKDLKPTGDQLITRQVKQQQQDPKKIIVELPKNNDPAPMIAQVPDVPNTNRINTGTTATVENRTAVNDGYAKATTPEIIPDNVAQPVSYTDELETEEDKTLYVGALEINPDKVRGFFRKAGRLLTGKKNNDEGNGRVQVANLEFNKLK